MSLAVIIINMHSQLFCKEVRLVHSLTLHCDVGVPINHLDRSGNTPLHYAAKYGHLDLCRVLIESNGSPALRNSVGQSPYDVAESHVVRQYLLPLQLAIEREMNPTSVAAIPPPPIGGMGNFFPGAPAGIPIYSTAPPPPSTATNPAYPPPPVYQSNPPPVTPTVHSVGAPVVNSAQGQVYAPPPSTSPAGISAPLGRPNVFVNNSTNLPVPSTSGPHESSSPPVIQHSTSGNDLQNTSPQTVAAPPPQWTPSIPSAPSSGSQTASRRVIQPGI
jgi:hypothetical protein